jgi:hypothetical protein
MTPRMRCSRMLHLTPHCHVPPKYPRAHAQHAHMCAWSWREPLISLFADHQTADCHQPFHPQMAYLVFWRCSVFVGGSRMASFRLLLRFSRSRWRMQVRSAGQRFPTQTELGAAHPSHRRGSSTPHPATCMQCGPALATVARPITTVGHSLPSNVLHLR